MNKIKTLLPGTDKQFQIFLQKADCSNKDILIIGSGCEEIARQFIRMAASVFVIVDNQDSLIQTRFDLAGEKKIVSRLMDFYNTDFPSDRFDIVYAQASVSSTERNKIIKEIKRILKPIGIFCVGEIVSLSELPPPFVKDIWINSGLNPLFTNNLKIYYEKLNFEIIYDGNLSYTLKDFYSKIMNNLNDQRGRFTEVERKKNRKLLNRINHESNVYMNLGGNEHIGFKVLIMRKK